MFTPPPRTRLTDAWPTKGGVQRTPEAFPPMALVGRHWGCPGLVLAPALGRAPPSLLYLQRAAWGRAGGERHQPGYPWVPAALRQL